LTPNIAAAQLCLQQELFDAIFLTLTNDQDIQSLIYQLPSSIPIVVVSPIKELASSAYEYENIVDFLLQPSCEARVWRALNRAQYTPILSNTRIEDSYAFIRSETQILKFNFNEIEYFSAFGSYSKVHTKTTFILLMSLSKV
jgi:DNA-binding LytR/AlgR family response regulator